MSLRNAINAKCKECIYDPIGGSGKWRQQVEACTSWDCPLFPVRPITTKSRKQRIQDSESEFGIKRVNTTNKDLSALENPENHLNGTIPDLTDGGSGCPK